MGIYQRTIWQAKCDHCGRESFEETDSSYLDHRLHRAGWKRLKDRIYCCQSCYDRRKK